MVSLKEPDVIPTVHAAEPYNELQRLVSCYRNDYDLLSQFKPDGVNEPYIAGAVTFNSDAPKYGCHSKILWCQ